MLLRNARKNPEALQSLWLKSLYHVFEEIDVDCSGSLNHEEISSFMRIIDQSGKHQGSKKPTDNGKTNANAIVPAARSVSSIPVGAKEGTKAGFKTTSNTHLEGESRMPKPVTKRFSMRPMRARSLRAVVKKERQDRAVEFARRWGEAGGGSDSRNLIVRLPEFVRGINETYQGQIVKKLVLIRWRLRNESFRICTCTIAQVAFLLHSPISRTLFQWFNCRRLGFRSFVRVDFTTECYGTRHVAHSLLVVSLILLFCVGLPVLVASILFANRKHLRAPSVRSRIGWLYTRYTVGSEWWDIHELLRKLVLCCVIMFINSALLRFAVAITLSVLSLVSLNRWHPHKNKKIFAVAEMAFFGTVMRYVSTLAMLVEENEDSYIGWFIVSVDLSVFSCAIAAVTLITMNLAQKARSSWAKAEAGVRNKMVTREHSFWAVAQTKTAMSKKERRRRREGRRRRLGNDVAAVPTTAVNVEPKKRRKKRKPPVIPPKPKSMPKLAETKTDPTVAGISPSVLSRAKRKNSRAAPGDIGSDMPQ
jgi:hypothetical protein